jgi:Uncharacterized conserved protein
MSTFTIGHGTRSLAELLALLREAGVHRLVDVRSFPRSRTNPQFNIDTLPAALAAAGIGYRHMPELGGRRRRPQGQGASPNGHWQNDGLRHFADYALTPAFAAGLDALRRMAGEATTAIMCAETAWQRCHRQIIADYLLARGDDVRHIVAPGRIEAADLAAAARRQPDGGLHYPPEQPDLLAGR